METFKCYKNTRNTKNRNIDFVSEEIAKEVRSYHESFPPYSITPLVNLTSLAEVLGIKGMYVKDESYRFGLNAFKVLGGSYAIGKYLSNELGSNEFTYDFLTSEAVKSKIKDITFISTTDGNHGRGVAWTSGKLGCKCIIHMPKGSDEERLNNIKKEGAEADISDFNYDDTVRISAKEAEENGYILVQDTSWPGYEDIPTWIIQGYTTMALEAYETLKSENIKPTHIFVQAGVGSLATAITGFFSNVYRENPPKIVIVEPNKADCVYRTAEADDGKIHIVDGSMSTIMAGLACGEPCSVGWPVLSDYADYFLSVPDAVAAKGMRILGNPANNDIKIISGESGAVTSGAVCELLMNENLDSMKKSIGLDDESVVLCFSTEGATSVEGYRNVVWDGMCPSI